MGAWRSRLLALAFGGCLGFLILGGFELLVRWFQPDEATGESVEAWMALGADGERLGSASEEAAFHRDRLRLHQSDPRLFWRNRPNLDLDFRGVRVRTNALGLRDEPLPAAKGNAELRILLLGESSAFGDRVEQRDTFAEILERKLDRRAAGCRVSVWNAGVTGYSLFQSVEWLDQFGDTIEPDWVMLYHGFNDFLPTSFAAERSAGNDRTAPTDRQRSALKRRPIHRLAHSLRRRSAAFRWLEHAFRTKSTLETATPTPAGAVGAKRDARAPVDALRVPEKDRRWLLERAQAWTRQREARLIALVPVYAEFDAHRPLLLTAQSTPLGGNDSPWILDLEPAVADVAAVRRAGDRARAFFGDGIHPRPPLHRSIAELLTHELLQLAASGRAPELLVCLEAAPEVSRAETDAP